MNSILVTTLLIIKLHHIKNKKIKIKNKIIKFSVLIIYWPIKYIDSNNNIKLNR